MTNLTGGTIGFYLEDTGIGVPLDAQEHIFESFAQTEKKYARC